ncbi:hypothetical protein [Providencia sp. Je.9.19]|uniref:hypothetical protein n=1 Tax=unclassified Providencia TaxID=2633465 RepID=UPI003DA91137
MKAKRNAENGFQFAETVFIMLGLMSFKWRYWFGLCWGRSDKLIQSLTVAVLSALFFGIECIIND